LSEESDVKLDLKISWKLLNENYKAFLMTELFAFLSFFTVMILAGVIFVIVVVSIPSLTFSTIIENIRDDNDFRYSIIATVFIGLSHITMVGFLNCQYGLAYDVMSSGDMFSEFKRAFKYFQKYWWQYILFSFISVFSIMIPRRIGMFIEPTNPFTIFIDIGIITAQLMIYFIFTIIANGTLPSVTAQGSFKNSFVETFRVLKKEPYRVLKTWTTYFFIFIFPVVAISFVRMELHRFLGPNRLYLIMDIAGLLLYLIYLFVGYPLKTIISTRIYNSVDFDRFKPLTVNKEEELENAKKLTEEKEVLGK